ncbi:MAG: AsmA-like C-terminal region-containing protein [Burkholderiaceae bacterium]
MAALRRFGRGLATVVASLLLLFFLLLLWIYFVGISVNLTQWREPISNKLTAVLDREVWLRGEVRFELSRNPELMASRVHIRNAGSNGVITNGFADIDWVYVGNAQVQFDAQHYLLTRGLRFRRVKADNLAVFLEARPDGSNNWTVEADGATEESPSPARPDAADKYTDRTGSNDLGILAGLAVDAIELNRLHVEYHGPDGKLRLYSIPTLSASAPSGKPVSANFRGVVDSLFPFDVEITGGSLGSLAEWSRPWPLTVITHALGSTMTLDGQLEPDKATVQFGWGTPDPAQAGRVLQMDFPDVGPTAVAAQLTISPGIVRLQNLRGWMGVTQLTGDVTILSDRERPLISGELSVPVLDLKPFMDGGEQQPGEASGGAQTAQSDAADFKAAAATASTANATAPDQATASIADWYRERAASVLDLSGLGQVDADLQLSVGRWLSLPGNVRNAKLHVQLVNGKLNAPVQAQLAGVAMQGLILMDGGLHEPRIDLSLGAAETPLGELAQLLFGLPGVRGDLQSIAFRLQASGTSVAEQVDNMTVNLAMAGGQLTYGNRSGLKPVAFGLKQLDLTINPGELLKVTADGSLLEQPLNIVFTSTPFRQLLSDGQSKIDFRARSRSMQARIRGAIGQKNSDGSIKTNLFIGITARRARDAAAWFGIGGKVNAPLSVAGQLAWDGENWAIREGRFGVGRNRIFAEVDQVTRGRHPLVRAKIRADRLNVDQLQALFESNVARQPEQTEGSMLNIPVLPADIDLTDTNLSLRIKHLTRSGMDIRDIAFDASIRNGRMTASPLAMTVLNVPLSGAVELDVSSKKPRGQWWLAGSDVNIGRLLKRFNLVDNLDARADLLSMHLDIKGNTLGDVLDKSNLTVEIAGGEFAIKDRNSGAAVQFSVDSATVKSPAGKPIEAKINGQWNKQPVLISLGSGRAVELIDSSKPIPVSVLLEVADTDFELFGKVGRDFGQQPADRGNRPMQKRLVSDSEIKLNLLMNGKRLDSLNKLSGVTLPPWGPYEITGVVKLSSDGYEVPNLSVTMGDSRLDGTGVVVTTQSPPRISVLLSANQLQIDDFKFGDWSPVAQSPDKTNDTAQDSTIDAASMRRQAREASDQTQSLLSEETLRSFNGGLRLNVNEVRSGADRLGSGSLKFSVFDGAATIGPIQVRLPDSLASLKLNYAPDKDGIDMRTQIKAEQFDYGFLARRIQPDTTVAGRLSMDVDISASTPSLSEAMQNSSGIIGFDVWPENIQADVFDLWATNLFLTLASRLDPSTASKINCGVVRFDMKDGVLKHQKILLDTTRVRVAGEGSVDFGTEALSLKMQPLPKKSEFFSLGTPIVVNGTFDDYSIGANPGDVVGTVIRLATSLVWVPLKKLFGRSMPDDGSDICGEPGRFLATVGQTAASQLPQTPADKTSDGQQPGKPSGETAPAVVNPSVSNAAADQSAAAESGPTGGSPDHSRTIPVAPENGLTKELPRPWKHPADSPYLNQ